MHGMPRKEKIILPDSKEFVGISERKNGELVLQSIEYKSISDCLTLLKKLMPLIVRLPLNITVSLPVLANFV